MEIVKKLSETTFIALENNEPCIVKQIFPEDIDVYKKIAEISSPHIAKIFFVGVVDNMLCAVRTFVQGTSLDKLLEQKGALSEKEAAKITGDVCEGLSHLHALGIVHRDINPNNIIISPEGTAVIIDFGISRIHKENKTQDTRILGTQGYAAPEQFGFGQTGVGADIYSVGVMLNYMLTRKMPNEQMANGNAGRVIEKCIRMDENKRYRNVTDVAKALRYRPFNMYIPGFDTGVPWHRSLAGLYYLLALFTILAALFVKGGSEGALAALNVIGLFLLPTPIIMNYRNWLRFVKAKKPVVKAIINTVFKAMFVFTAWMLWTVLLEALGITV